MKFFFLKAFLDHGKEINKVLEQFFFTVLANLRDLLKTQNIKKIKKICNLVREDRWQKFIMLFKKFFYIRACPILINFLNGKTTFFFKFYF